MCGFLQKRRGLAISLTTLMYIVFAFVAGTAALSFSQQNFEIFTKNLSDPFSNDVSRIQESLVIENVIFHNSTQQFNVTLTNTGYIPINVTSIMIQKNTNPSFNETARTSSTSPVSLVTAPNSLSATIEIVTVPGTVIVPGQAYTTVIPYHCFCDPITITAKTSRGTIITKNIAPNVGWFDSREQFRKRITVNLSHVAGNPSPIILDNTQSLSGSTSSNTFTLSNFIVNQGFNRLLVVGIETDGATASTVTYAGQRLTLANATQSGNGHADSELWYLTNPPSGQASISVTTSASANIVVGGYSLFGVDQTTPIAEGNKIGGTTGTSTSTTFSTTYPQSWVIDSISVKNASPPSANAGQTADWSIQNNGISGGSSYELINNPTAITTKWTWTGNSAFAYVSTEVRASAFYDFPLLVNMTDTNLQQNANGENDIFFTACDGMTRLNYEIENYTYSTGSLTAWVRLPQLYSTPNNIVYMYYNYTKAATNPTTNYQSTWDSTYSAVYHFAHSPPATGNPPIIDNYAYNFVNSSSTNSTTTIHQFTIGGYNSRLLVAIASTDNPNAYQSIAYGGQALTKLPHALFNVDSEIWYLVNPPIGSADLVGTLNSAGSGKNYMFLGVYSIHGVDQITPVNPIGSVSGTNVVGPQTATVSIINNYGKSLLIDMASVGYGAQAGCCVFKHPHWDLENPTQTEEGPNAIDINHVTAATSYASPTQACTTTVFSWHIYSATDDTWTDAAVEIKSNSSSTGDLTIQDSTSHQNFLSPVNLPTCGQVNGVFGGGASLNGVNQFFTRNTTLTDLPLVNGPQTVSGWYTSPGGGTFPQDLTTLQYALSPSGASTSLKTGFQTSSTNDAWKYSPTTNIVSTSAPSLNTWHYLVYTFNGTQNKLYIDGIIKATSTVTPPSTSRPDFLFIGASSSNYNPDSVTEHFKGTVDEIRYSTIVRSASWIATEYNNQAHPSAFVTVGPQESVLTPRPPG